MNLVFHISEDGSEVNYEHARDDGLLFVLALILMKLCRECVNFHHMSPMYPQCCFKVIISS